MGQQVGGGHQRQRQRPGQSRLQARRLARGARAQGGTRDERGQRAHQPERGGPAAGSEP